MLGKLSVYKDMAFGKSAINHLNMRFNRFYCINVQHIDVEGIMKIELYHQQIKKTRRAALLIPALEKELLKRL